MMISRQPSKSEYHASNDCSVLSSIHPGHNPFPLQIITRTPNIIAAVKRLIRYLEGTLDFGVMYGTAHGPQGYMDVHWASDQETRRSLGAYVFLLEGRGSQLDVRVSAIDRTVVM